MIYYQIINQILLYIIKLKIRVKIFPESSLSALIFQEISLNFSLNKSIF